MRPYRFTMLIFPGNRAAVMNRDMVENNRQTFWKPGMKLFLRFLLFCILLLAGYAQASPVRTGCSPKDLIEKAEPVNFSPIHNHRLRQGKAPSSDNTNAQDVIADYEVDDDDDDESKAGKKKGINDRFSLMQSQALAGIYHYNNRLPFCDHFSLAAACKFIFHCVIRI